MAKQNRGRRSLVLLLVVVLGLLLLINVTGDRGGQLTPVEDALLALFAPVQRVFSSGGRQIQSFFDAVVSFQEQKEENERLREEIAFIQQQLVQFEELRIANHRYRQLLGFKESRGLELLAAEVIARDPSQWFGTITINRGYLDGVKREAPVVTDRGLVGMVSTVSPNSSQIILITDPRLAVSAMVQRSREPGTVGTGTVESYTAEAGLLKITNLPPETPIQEGDKVISSGLGGIFPKGLFIGTVTEIGGDQFGLVLSATIESGVNFNRLEEVFIVLGTGPDSPDPDEPGEADEP